MADLEKILEHLKRKGISIADVYGRLEMERGYFDGRRRSVNADKRDELAKQILEAFHAETEGVEFGDEPKTENKIEMKYIALLEKRLQEVEAERDKWKQLAEQKQETQPPK